MESPSQVLESVPIPRDSPARDANAPPQCGPECCFRQRRAPLHSLAVQDSKEHNVSSSQPPEDRPERSRRRHRRSRYHLAKCRNERAAGHTSLGDFRPHDSPRGMERLTGPARVLSSLPRSSTFAPESCLEGEIARRHRSVEDDGRGIPVGLMRAENRPSRPVRLRAENGP